MDFLVAPPIHIRSGWAYKLQGDFKEIFNATPD